MEEEGDSRLIVYVSNTRAERTIVLTYLSAYFDKFIIKNIEKIQLKHRLKERQRHIPILCLADILGSGKSRALFKIHTENKTNSC